MVEVQPQVRLARAASDAREIDRPDLSLRVEQGLAMAKLLVHSPAADARFAELMGFAPPQTGRQTEAQGLAVAWMAPGEWLLTGDEATVPSRVATVVDAEDVLLVDLSHARTSFLLTGSAARTALAAHCPIDLGPDIFPVGAVARTLLGETAVMIVRLPDSTASGADTSCFRIIVDQTMAAYAARMIAGPERRGEDLA